MSVWQVCLCVCGGGKFICAGVPCSRVKRRRVKRRRHARENAFLCCRPQVTDRLAICGRSISIELDVHATPSPQVPMFYMAAADYALHGTPRPATPLLCAFVGLRQQGGGRGRW